MAIPELPDLATFGGQPTPEPAPGSERNKVDPIVVPLSGQDIYLHGAHIPRKRQYLAATVDRRPLLRIEERERYAKVVVDVSPTGYSLTAEAIKRIYATTTPYFEDAENNPSRLRFKFQTASDSIGLYKPREEVSIDGLEIESAKELLDDLAEVVGSYNDFVYLGEEGVEDTFGPERYLPREGAPEVHQPEGVDDPFQVAPIENKSVTTQQIKDHYSESTLEAATELTRFTSTGAKRYWAIAGHANMHGKGVSGFCKDHAPSREPACSVYITSGEIVEETCHGDHDAPCRHTAAALFLAESVSEHYL